MARKRSIRRAGHSAGMPGAQAGSAVEEPAGEGVEPFGTGVEELADVAPAPPGEATVQEVRIAHGSFRESLGQIRVEAVSSFRALPRNRRFLVAGLSVALPLFLVVGLVLGSTSLLGPQATPAVIYVIESPAVGDATQTVPAWTADPQSTFSAPTDYASAAPTDDASAAPVTVSAPAGPFVTCRRQLQYHEARPTPSVTPAPIVTAAPTATAETTSSAAVYRPGPPILTARQGPTLASTSGWTRGGTAELDFGGNDPAVIWNGHLYLATVFTDMVESGDGVPALCVSTDLIHWRLPTRTEFVNWSEREFLPSGSIPVKQGYAAAGRDYEASAWYSSDGIHWLEGIPAGVSFAPESPTACPGFSSAFGGGCTWISGLGYVEDNGLHVTKDGGDTWVNGTLPPNVSGLRQVQHPSSGLFAALASLAACAAGQVCGGPPQVVLTSTDGISWTRANLDPIGPGADPYLASVGRNLYVLGTQNVVRSSDGGKTWTDMVDAAGDLIEGEAMSASGSKVCVFSHGTTGWMIDWIANG